jgi:hypothetical protein
MVEQAGDAASNSVEKPERRGLLNLLRRNRRRLVILLVIAAALGAGGVWVFKWRESQPVQATSPDPAIAVRQEKIVHGVRWGLSYEAALEQAATEDTPILLYFAGLRNGESSRLDNSALPDAQVIPFLSQFVRAKLYLDIVPIESLSQGDRAQLARANVEKELSLREDTAAPSLMILTPKGKVVTKRDGYQNPRDLAAFLKRALAQARYQARLTPPLSARPAPSPE